VLATGSVSAQVTTLYATLTGPSSCAYLSGCVFTVTATGGEGPGSYIYVWSLPGQTTTSSTLCTNSPTCTVLFQALQGSVNAYGYNSTVSVSVGSVASGGGYGFGSPIGGLVVNLKLSPIVAEAGSSSLTTGSQTTSGFAFPPSSPGSLPLSTVSACSDPLSLGCFTLSGSLVPDTYLLLAAAGGLAFGSYVLTPRKKP
jgi:hypothetical protein